MAYRDAPPVPQAKPAPTSTAGIFVSPGTTLWRRLRWVLTGRDPFDCKEVCPKSDLRVQMPPVRPAKPSWRGVAPDRREIVTNDQEVMIWLIQHGWVATLI